MSLSIGRTNERANNQHLPSYHKQNMGADYSPRKVSKQSKGQILLDDFLVKVDKSLAIMREKGVITLDELQPAWEARAKLEALLNPPRDSRGHFVAPETLSNDLSPRSEESTDAQGFK